MKNHFFRGLLAIGVTAVSVFLLYGFIMKPDKVSKMAASGGELSFTVRTVSTGGTYSPKHVLAIWIEQEGDFVKTRKAMANSKKQYLYTWKAASNYNVVDAITGPTLTSHQTHTVTWDCTDLEGNILPDGEYEVIAEFTDKHAQGPLYSLAFTKGSESITINPEDETYFKDIELTFTPFIAEFSADLTEICQGESVIFTDESINAGSWEWDFGEGATPGTATTQGPHTVYYSTPGVKSVTLTINGSVTEDKTDLITVTAQPEADFSWSSNALTVDFNNLSVNASDYYWDFDDGNTSNQVSPVHTYSSGGSYDVTLEASALDCQSSLTILVTVPMVGFQNHADAGMIRVFPNPASGKFILEKGNTAHIEKIGIFAANGNFIPLNINGSGDYSAITVDVTGIESGVYLLQLQTEAGVITRKIVIR